RILLRGSFQIGRFHWHGMHVFRRNRRMRQQTFLDVRQIPIGMPGGRGTFIHLHKMDARPRNLLIRERAQHDPWRSAAAHRQNETAAFGDCGASLTRYHRRSALGGSLIVGKNVSLHVSPAARKSSVAPSDRARVYTAVQDRDGIPGTEYHRRRTMRNFFFLYVAALAAVAVASAQTPAVKIKTNDIGGVVASTKGPEAGVWVIAETTDLGTRYIKEVVTDDRGRYLLPQLPKARYTVWARGYGLADSPKVATEPGKLVNLKPGIAPDTKTAAQLYPGNYWYSLLKVPAKNEFPGTGPSGNGISPNLKTQGQWIHLIKTDSCESCHQLGNLYTRTIPALFSNLDSPAQAWLRRVQSGQAGNAMIGGLNQLGPERATAEFGDWTTRIAKGELPFDAPPRPQGVERNVVITQWDWADPKAYLHD